MLVDFVNLFAPIALSLYLLGMTLKFGRWFLAVRYPRLKRKGVFLLQWRPRLGDQQWSVRNPELLTD